MTRYARKTRLSEIVRERSIRQAQRRAEVRNELIVPATRYYISG